MKSFYKAMFAGLASGAAVVALSGAAHAADLGGGCCADLEERVAELEATVARKGNRVVTLQIYGDVTQGLLIWDNGKQSDAYVVDNDALGSLVGFTGEAKLKPGWKAGYKMELQVQSASSSQVTEGTKGDDPSDIISIRHNYVYIESEKYGRISLGQQSTASDGAAEVSVANTLISSSPDHGTALHPGAGVFTLGTLASDFDGGRDDLIRYDSPTIYGFVVSASWGDNDYWDVALRFSKEWNSVKIAAAIAYADSSTGEALNDFAVANFTQVIGSVSAMHVPTGLFLSFSAGERNYKDSDVDGSFYFLQGGIERKWLPYGTTTIYGEYGNYDDVAVADANAKFWGLGVVQHIDAAAMDIYAQARFWDTDATFLLPAEKPIAIDSGDLTTVMVGSRIQF
jgi:predicted porin